MDPKELIALEEQIENYGRELEMAYDLDAGFTSADIVRMENRYIELVEPIRLRAQ